VPLLLALDGRVHPGLALATVVEATRTRDVGLRLINVNAASLLLDSRTVPLDGKSNLLLRYRGGKAHLPLRVGGRRAERQTPRRNLQGQDRLRWNDALGTREVVATPIDTLFAGVEVQATRGG
jgi:adenylate cyclase